MNGPPIIIPQDYGKLGLTITVAVRPRRTWRLWLAVRLIRIGAWLIGSEAVFEMGEGSNLGLDWGRNHQPKTKAP